MGAKMFDYITWNDLKKRWEKMDFQLLKYLKKGLQPYSRNEVLIICPRRHHEYHYLQNRYSEVCESLRFLEKHLDYDELINKTLPSFPEDAPNQTREERIKKQEKAKLDIYAQIENFGKIDPQTNKWEYFVMPQTDEEIDNIISDLKETFFKMKDVLEFGKIHGLGKTIKEGKQRPSQKARDECREITKKLRTKYPDMPIFQMKNHPEIMKVAKEWVASTRQRWICDLFPEHLRKPGRKREILLK
jgi:hypothetical protein